MSKLPAVKVGTIARGEVVQLLLDAPMPENVEPRVYCAPRGAVEISEWSPQRVTIRMVGAVPMAAYMLVYASGGIVALETIARAGVEFWKARRAARGR